MNLSNFHRHRSVSAVVRAVVNVVSAITPLGNIRGAAGEYRRVAVLLQWGIGDAVLALPLIHGLAEAYPRAEIHLLGKPWLADLFADESRISAFKLLVPPWTKCSGKYRIWEQDWRKFLNQIRAIHHERYDLIIGPRLDVRDAFQLRLLGAHATAGFAAAGGRGWITNDFKLDLDEHDSQHRSEIAALALQELTGRPAASTPRFEVRAPSKDGARKRLEQNGYTAGPIIVVHGGAGSLVRRWGGERFSEALAASVPRNAFVVVVADEGSPDGYGIKAPPGTVHMLWRGSLAELKGLLSIADVLVCADSGAMHIAAACGCRVVAVFGPGRLEWFGPTGHGHRVVKVDPMPCRPCFDACIYDRPICMEKISVSAVAEAVIDALRAIRVKERATLLK